MAKVVSIATYRAKHRKLCEHCHKPMPAEAVKPGEVYVCRPCQRVISEKLKRGEGVTLRAM